MTLVTDGELQEGCTILLSDCYLDRLNFMKNSRPDTWDDKIHTLYSALNVSETGVWYIEWKDGAITLTVNGKTTQGIDMTASPGLNHIGILFTDKGKLKITHFEAKAYDNRWATGIEY